MAENNSQKVTFSENETENDLHNSRITEIDNEKEKEDKRNVKIESKYQGRSQQSLPHILSDYGLENNRQKKKKSARRRRDRRKRRENEILQDDERDLEREKLKEEKYLSVVDDLRKLRNYYYREYRDLLTEKIIRQRQEIKDRTENMLAMAQQKEKEEREANKSKRKLTKHKLVHNEDFLKNIPVTDTSKIVNLQMRLQKQGTLKSQSDIDDFWRDIRNPEVFAAYFDVSHGGSPDNVFVNNTNRPLSQINESAESSRPTTRGENWALTQQVKLKGQNRQKNNSCTIKQTPMDKRFNSVDMPPLHCFTMDLSEKPPDPEEIRKKIHFKAVEKQRKKFMGKLQKMHQLAMANNALASRILAQHEDLNMFLQGPELSDLIADYYYNKPESRQLAVEGPPSRDDTSLSGTRYPVLPEIPSSRRSSEISPSPSPEQIEDQPLQRPTSEVTSEKKLRMIMEKPSSPLPLTMDELMSHYKVVEAKGLSTNWNNYMRAGKAM